MSSGRCIQILFLFIICSNSLNVQAQRKKKKEGKTIIEKKGSGTITKKDSVAPAVIRSAPVVAKKPEAVKPFAQLVVSFSSAGEGIDIKARDQFLEHITWFNTTNHCELMYDKKPWGREGEIDYCFFGNNQILMPGLYKQLKEKFFGKPGIFINENFPCK